MRGVRGLVLGAGMVLAGCEPSPGIDAAQVCDEFCACTAPLPAAHAACVDECTTDLAGFDIPDACMECLEEDACAALERCFDSCL